MPVNEVDKPHNVWCKFARPGTAHACSIYNDRPTSCRVWACYWLQDELNDLPDEARPDRAHYVVDGAGDIVTVGEIDYPAVQVWADPAYPSAWRTDEALARFMRMLGTRRIITLIRHTPTRATCCIPPSITGAGWVERTSECDMERSEEETYNQLKAMMNIED